MFKGGFCEQPPLDLIRAVARSCYVVDDDLLIGFRWLLEDVSPDGDPLFNLAEAYLEIFTVESAIAEDAGAPEAVVFRIKIDSITGVSEGDASDKLLLIEDAADGSYVAA